jgi:MFS family permease
MGRYTRNIRLNYLFVWLFSMNLTHGIWMIYLASKGYSLAQLGVLEGTYHVTSFLMEVPTGVIADLWGRKTSRIVGRIIAAASTAIMFFAPNFALLAVAFAATALGNNLESGAGDALLYDSLLLDGEQDKYIHVAGKQELTYQSASITSFLLGGYLAVRSYPLVFALTALSSILAACLAIGFSEPEIERPREEGPNLPLARKIRKSLEEQATETIGLLRRRKQIAFFIVFSESLFCFLTVLFFYLQNLWVAEGKTEFDIGIVFACNAVVAGITALFAGRIERRIGERGVLTTMPLLLVVCLWGVAIGVAREFFYVVTGFMEGILIASIGTYLNRLIPSAQRATILSVQSMAFSMFMIVMFPLFGAIGDHWSLDLAFCCMAALSTVLCIAYMVFFKPFALEKRGIDTT